MRAIKHWYDPETWPSFRVAVELAPWHWHFDYWGDEGMTRSWTLTLGPIRIERWTNRMRRDHT